MSQSYNAKNEQDLPILDLSLLNGYVGSLGSNIVEQMFSLYKQQVILYLSAIEEAQQIDSSSSWKESCHKMKGASASVGLLKLYGLLVVLEKSNATQADKAVLLSELKAENEKGLFAFQQWLTKTS